MARKPKIPEHVNHERWLVSYADFITLLFAFFTVLYATAQTDAGKVNKLVGAVERSFSAGMFSSGSNELMFVTPGNTSGREILDIGMNLKDVEKNISSQLKREGTSADNIKLERHAEGLTIQLRTNTFFTPGSDALRPEALAILPGVVDVIKMSKHKLRIEGHTDDMPIHNEQFSSNWELSTARALSVLRYLILSGVAPSRLAVAGLAEFKPLQPNTSSEGRSRNRRVEIVILENKPSFWANVNKKQGKVEPTISAWKPLIANDHVAPNPSEPPTLSPVQEEAPTVPEPSHGPH
ncbi:MAG: OmpA family protein [Elusimicrobia bacterium]|jgi:chemotaxis protein MotB|nr:OmpA family protein [Elusimicrobiota bacterium]